MFSGYANRFLAMADSAAGRAQDAYMTNVSPERRAQIAEVGQQGRQMADSVAARAQDAYMTNVSPETRAQIAEYGQQGRQMAVQGVQQGRQMARQGMSFARKKAECVRKCSNSRGVGGRRKRKFKSRKNARKTRRNRRKTRRY